MTFEDIIKCGNDTKEKNRLDLYKDIINIKEKKEKENDNIDNKKRERYISI